MTDSNGPGDNEMSLTKISERRQASEERTRDGQSGPVLYHIEYNKNSSEVVPAKSTEVGRVAESDRMDLEAIKGEGYTHYAIFRLKDRSTVTIVQDESGNLYKIFSLGHGTVEIAHSVTITEAPE
jgi:hypothetical protein